LATIETKFLSGPEPDIRAKGNFISCLEGAAKKLGRSSYASMALRLLSDDWEKIQLELAARILITQLVPAFLSGPEGLARVRRRGRPASRRNDRGSKELIFTGEPILNPLDFIEHEIEASVDAHRSFWMLQRLAFDVETESNSNGN
jgi:hypothetical protein